MKRLDIVVVGAGPYGLSAASHLRTIKGLKVGVFGNPMSFWRHQMPLGMLLRSNWTATEIANPNGSLTLEAFQASTGRHFSTPVPLDCFVEYGLWYQKNAVPDLDQRNVSCFKRNPEGFRLTLEDGESLTARRVVIAAGIKPFVWRPPEFDELPSLLASHSSVHRDFKQFAGKRVLVIGAGQSALESAALIHEEGSEVEVVARAHRIHWLQGLTSKMLHHHLGSTIRHSLYAPTDVGPAGLSHICARPDLMRRLPRWVQDRIRKRAVRPAGARWLVERLKDVPIHLGRRIVSVIKIGKTVRIRLDNGLERTVDHVLLGTGYRVDISRYSFVDPELLRSIDRVNGYPRLRQGLETSVRDLHILGAPAAWSFGPLMQFVSGTTYAAQALTRHIARQTDPKSAARNL